MDCSEKEPGLKQPQDKKERNGAGDEIRTRDIDLGKVALYQLSYSRKLRRLSLCTERLQVSNRHQIDKEIEDCFIAQRAFENTL
jgi:hypothetical protein